MSDEIEPPNRPRRPRVAVVFGGRSTEHAVSCVSRRQRARGARPRPVRRRAGRHHRARAGGCWPPTTRQTLAITGGELPEVDRPGGAAWCCRRPDRPAAWSCSSPARCPRELGEVDVVLPVAARPVRRGRHDPGPARAGRRAVRRLRRVRLGRRDGQGPHEGRCWPGAGLPVGPYAVVTAARVGDRPAAVRETVRGARAARSSSSRPGPAPASASPRSHGPDELDDADRGGPRARPEGARRGGASSAARSSAGCSRASTAAPPRASLCGEIRWSAATTSSTTSRRSTSTRRTEFDIPADLPGRRRPPGRRRWLCGRSTRWTAKDWPGSTSSSPATARSSSTRSTRCPASRRCRCSRGCGRPAGLDYPALVDRLVQTALRRATGLR